jgi:hypothetical protein
MRTHYFSLHWQTVHQLKLCQCVGFRKRRRTDTRQLLADDGKLHGVHFQAHELELDGASDGFVEVTGWNTLSLMQERGVVVRDGCSHSLLLS